MRTRLIERFWSKVARCGDDECWLWTPRACSNGYGQFKANRKMFSAHRVAWLLSRGPIPSGLNVCHKCDVRLCVNPSHLFLGTYQDNESDKKAKGRQAYGERNGLAKLTDETVRAIRASQESGSSIARRMGVSANIVCAARAGRTWRHVA